MRAETGTATTVKIVETSPNSAAAQLILRAYIADVASRWYGRQATGAEVDAALAEHPTDGLTPPRGVFFVAFDHDVPVGCAGIERVEEATDEVKRVFVAPSARRHGLGRRLLESLEACARGRGATRTRLDTRADLVESRALYESVGYAPVEAFDGGPYSECWYAKVLG